MTAYQQISEELRAKPRHWLITGVAGFIGSHLLEKLLRLGQRVTGLDNFATGSRANLQAVESAVTPEEWARFRFHEGSVAQLEACRDAARGVEVVLHEAGFVSVPLSLQDPLACHETNVTGTLNLLLAAREHGIRRFVYASSSAVYGDDPRPQKVEEQLGRPLSPYGASKLMGEIYAGLAADHYGLEGVGLRYFNVFGPRQDATGGYAAVIPQWIARLRRGEPCRIHGNGTQTRDYCPVANVVQANLLAGALSSEKIRHRAYNVALGGCTSLNELHRLLLAALPEADPLPPEHGPPRAGDIEHSSADIRRLQEDLGYQPEVNLAQGLEALGAKR